MEFSPRTNAEKAKELVESADGLLLIDCFGVESLQVPSKLFHYIRVGRPILAITMKNSPTERILSQSGVPHTMMYWGDSVAVNAPKLAEFLALPSISTHPSEWFLKTFDGKLHTRMLASVFDHLWRGPAGNRLEQTGADSRTGALPRRNDQMNPGLVL